MTEPKLAVSPLVTEDARPYWDAAAAGKLLIQNCNSCSEPYVHPRPFCPFCMSDDVSWIEASGRGTIYTYTVTARAPVFTIPAMIALEEGPVMMSAIVGADPTDVAIGGRVAVGFAPTIDGPPLPVFTLAA
ncbi:MAG: OB-fold domain-containing protein [Sphingomonadaceae bacterium]|nr:OB-fold domain-containing protein [Sphingomonadaceae bacterium]